MADGMTHAQLYDLLQEWFGVGTYDELVEREPWYKARMTEIGKLKRQMTSRHVTVETVLDAARFAHERHRPITATWQIIELIPEARRAARENRASPVTERLQNAVQEAVSAGESDWAYRLVRSGSVEALDA